MIDFLIGGLQAVGCALVVFAGVVVLCLIGWVIDKTLGPEAGIAAVVLIGIFIVGGWMNWYPDHD